MEVIPDSVVVGYVHPNIVTEGWAHSLAKACLYTPNEIIGIVSSTNPRQEAARNSAIARFLEGFPDGEGNTVAGEWFMWIDTDQRFEMDAIARLRQTAESLDAQACGGLTFIYGRADKSVKTNGFLWSPEENDSKGGFKSIEDYRSGGKYVIDATGSAFVLMHRTIFDQKESDWHTSWSPHPDTGAYMGHDIAFFYDACVKGPHKLVWDTSVVAPHIKSFDLDEAAFRNYQASQEQ